MRNYVHTIDKQISINAIKKIGAPLLGLAKYIYFTDHWSRENRARGR